MSESRTLFTYHDLTVEVESSPGDELIEHLHSTVLGTPGGFRYQQTNFSDRLSSLGENYFLFLRKSGKMLGSLGFCGRSAEVEGVPHDSWLIRYFSIKAPMRSVPTRKKEQADMKTESKRTSVLGRFLQPVGTNPSILRAEAKEDVPAIMYGIVEQKNLRSLNFSTQMGLETVGEMASFSFNRMIPGKSDRVEQLPGIEQASMLALIREYYRDYTLFIPDPLFKDDQYYVIKESGRVVAGLQVYFVTWRIVDFGSGLTNRLIRLITRIQWVRKRINPDELRLLAFDGIYCEPGYESTLYELMEGVLERTNTYLAMLMMDTGSDLYTIFREHKKLGILHKVLGTFMADIKVRFINLPDKVRQYYMDHPTYIPTYDNS